MKPSMLKPVFKTMLRVAMWASMSTATFGELPVVQASAFSGLMQMEQVCAAAPGDRCVLVVSTPQVITLTHAHALPAAMQLHFVAGGSWTVNGATLTITSGVVDAGEDAQIFGGSAEIRGLANARPEWFTAAADVYPAAAMASAYRSTVAWGTVLLRDAIYVSPFTDFTGGDGCGGLVYGSPRRFLGAGRPHVDDESQPHKLLEGTVIRGEICGTAPLQMAHLGVDAGPQVERELYRGVKPNGIYLPNSGGFNPKRGTQLKDVSVLTSDADGEHSVLIEGEDGALVDGLWIWSTGGTHGLIVKSAHTVVRNFHCKGASADCLLVKSDYKTDGDGFANGDSFQDIDISYLARPGDTGGIGMDAGWDNVSDIVFDRVHEDGLKYGFAGGGSWFYKLKGVAIRHWSARQILGPCTRFYHHSEVRISDSSCADGPSVQVKSTAGTGFKDFVIQIKRHLRIVWTTFCTWFRRSFHRLF